MRSAPPPSVHLGRALVFLLGLGATLASVRCYAPTQVTVIVTTDLDCAQTIRTAIHVGTDGTAPEAETSACTGSPPRSEVGTLVVVPSDGRDGKATVRVVLATGNKSPETCVSGSLDCVVASRSFSFIEHSGLRLPIHIFKECLGKVCAANETCVAGARCVSNEVGCTGDGCDLRAPDSDGGGPIIEVADAADGGPIAVDAAPAKKCLGPNANGILTTAANMPPYRLAAASNDAFFFTDNGAELKSPEFVKVAKATGLRTVLGSASGPLGSGPLIVAASRTGIGMFGRAVSVGPTTIQSVVLEGAFNSPFVVPSTVDDGLNDIASAPLVTPNGALFYVLTTDKLSAAVNGALSDLILPGGTRAAADNATIYIASSEQIRAYKLDSLAALGAITLKPAPVLDGPAFTFNGTTLFVGGVTASGTGKATILKLSGAEATAILPSVTGAPISLAADATHVYWTDGSVVRRAGHQGNGAEQIVVPESTGAQLNHLAVDDDCLYYWLGPTGTPAELHVTPKQP